MAQKQYVTWNEVDEFVNEVVQAYHGAPLSGVYGLPRGGLILAVMISNRLRIPMLTAPCEHCLIVDDICDTGESLIHYAKDSSAEEKPFWDIITMFYKENELNIHPTIYKYKKEDKWIVFPWEDKEDA